MGVFEVKKKPHVLEKFSATFFPSQYQNVSRLKFMAFKTHAWSFQLMPLCKAPKRVITEIVMLARTLLGGVEILQKYNSLTCHQLLTNYCNLTYLT